MSEKGASSGADPEVLKALKKYVIKTCPAILSGDAKTLEAAASTKETEEIFRIFATDANISALIVQKKLKRLLKPDEDPALVTDNEVYEFQLQVKPMVDSNGGCSMAFIKISSPFEASRPINSQVHVCQLDDANPFHAILAYVRHCFLPISRNLMAQALEVEKKGDQDVATIRGVNAKMSELEVELLRSQESIAIPHITLEVNKAIADFVKAGDLTVSKLPNNGDATFLNEIQAGLNGWKKLILSVTRLNRDVDSGTTMQEINFWRNMESAIQHIYAERESAGVDFTFQVLKENKRFLATTGFMPDVGLADDKEKDNVYKYSNLLKDLPIKRLLSATDCKAMIPALEAIFQHLKQIRRIEYPLARAIQLMHAISRDVVTTLQSVLNSRRPMALNYEEFKSCADGAEELFHSWDTWLEVFNDELRDLKKSRTDENILNIATPYTEMQALRQRVQEVATLRREDFELRDVISSTLTSDPIVKNSALKAIAEAFQHLREVDVLATSADGTALFQAARQSYKARIDRVESDLEERIRQMLNAAKDDANEMFRVCAKFNALFVRPRIQSAIREYQEQLIATVKKDIEILQEKFKSTYSKSNAKSMSTVRDLPPVSGAIIWGRQIERQLATYMSRVEDVLGKTWHHHVEGRQLKRESDQFKDRLQPENMFQEWLTQAKKVAQFEVDGRIFKIETHGTQVRLGVNFDSQLITLFKEVRNLTRLGLKVPYEIKIAADEAKEKYPYAMRLEEVIRTYMRTCSSLDQHQHLYPLAAKHRKQVQDSISQGIFLQWDTERLKKYVDTLGTEAVEYQDQVGELLLYAEKASVNLGELATCSPTAQAFKKILDEVQAVIDHLDKRGYSNLRQWVDVLDSTAEDSLVKRLKAILFYWVKAQDLTLDHLDEGELDLDAVIAEEKARKEKEAQDDDNYDADERKAAEERAKSLDFVCKEPAKHRITIRNQVLHVDPPLEYARLHLSKDLQTWLSVICELPRLKCFWTQSGEAVESKISAETFRSALRKLATEDVQQCHNKITDKIAEASKYVETWLQYQALWDMDIETVVASLGTDLKKWEKLLLDMKLSRSTFDNSRTSKRFGPIVIEYGSVQTKVNNKYDQWHKNILTRYGQMLAGMITKLYTDLGHARKTLETFHFEFSTTKEIIDSVTLLQRLSDSAKVWKVDLDKQNEGEQLLHRQRFQFPGDWTYMERVQGEWNAFEQILNRKLQKMHKDSDKIQGKIAAEATKLEQRVSAFCTDWKTNRPVGTDLEHSAVMASLASFDGKLTGLQEEVERMKLAREALKMPQKEEVRLIPIREELDGLKAVWDVLGASFGSLDELGNTLLKDAKPKEIRRGLNKLQTDIQRLPSDVRQYAGYEQLKNKIKDVLGIHHAVSELVEAPLRPKHQKQILNILKIDSIWADANLNQLWGADIKRHMKQIRFVLEQAQGESALEEFLADVAAKWEATKLELVDYRNKCFLIKNWDSLFEQLGDFISDLGSMKHSPFYPAFESEAQKWETKLNHAQAIFDVFIDVQRRWVYLEGIFTNSQDVQVQLAYQYKQFCGFDRDFVRLMREMNREDLADYWVKPERNLLEKMKDYAATLDAIQKALAEYLEKQRQIFPRFYFVGDEDLLEIIGNSKNVQKIQRHLPKMFAGIARLDISEDDTILGMKSREGELVKFDVPIKVPEHKTIHGWLKLIESQMRDTLASMLEKAINQQSTWRKGDNVDSAPFFKWVGAFPAQVVLLATQIDWSELTEEQLAAKKAPTGILARIEKTLGVLADNILDPNLEKDLRNKYEQLITELVHQRDVLRVLIADKILSPEDYVWLGHTRFYFNRKPPIEVKNATGDSSTKSKLIIQVSRATFYYGFEYLGVGERLVQTPLTDRCYLTMCEALHMRLGGNPYGPAGTGKTESVKALGSTLGRFVLVFNCDENFDFNAMGRIFVGLCQCGAWGCFDEFNRLEERILSAVSQQILTIQVGLQKYSQEIQLLGKPVKLNANMGMFVTMNPGYAGRSNLPDNLKQLFRGIAMIKPNGALIGQVMLFSQGFRTAEELAGKVVLLFQLCSDQLSTQSHYDFGLRALKSVLRSSGNLKRAIIQFRNQPKEEEKKPAEPKEEEKKPAEGDEGDAAAAPRKREDPINGLDASSLDGEQAILVKSISGTIVPKLVSADVPLFTTLLTAVFPSAKVSAPIEEDVLAAIRRLCKTRNLIAGTEWVDKIMQFYEILTIHHGVIMVGPSGAGKTSAWTILQAAVESAHKKKIETYVIDPKALSKDDLYGVLDNTTLEWTDGVFTHILRKIIDNVRGEASKDHWIIFDGDVDPEWAENLNSVLDDNKLFTLPNGERLALGPNIRILFEVENLNHATPATVSRCGMVWFSELVLTVEMVLENMFLKLSTQTIDNLSPTIYNRYKGVQVQAADSIKKYFCKDEAGNEETSFLIQVLVHMGQQEHIMNFTRARALMSTLSMLKAGIAKIIEYNDTHSDFALSQDKVASFMEKQLVYSVLWGFSGDMSLKDRIALGNEMGKFTKIPLPRGEPLIDWEVRVDTGDWHLWADRVPAVDLEANKVVKPDVVIQTVDTIRHVDVIGSWLADHRPLILCGPPGSGKSMTLVSVLMSMPDFELVTLNFSSTTGVDLILRTLKHYCSCEKTPKGNVMRPHARGKWLVIFCDEINLPMNDAYETQMVITFLRQITEYGGFWRAADQSFITLERIQIIGACNPPADAGRVRLSDRFLRHCPLMFVDFPSIPSLRQIYGTLNRALMKLQPPLRNQADPLTEAMIDVYAASQARFTPDLQPHYIYSPRELSRWVRAMYEAINPSSGGEGLSLSLDELVRLWAHEALRLFSDRLTEQAERDWTDIKINEAANKHFRGANLDVALQRPILYSNWLTKQYVSVEQDVLREHVLLRLQVFREEELDVKLVVFDEVLEHILRIDRVLRQPLGHMLLVGASGGGKTVLSKFVAWMSGMSTFQIKVHKFYKASDFDHDLRDVLIRSGCQAEKICFIFDESNVLDSAFLERMNALLASGEVPGLFEGADWDALMEACKLGTGRDGLIINKEDELYKWFCGEVQRNLHVVFTMNPANEDFDNRSATSPALFNRCVIDWFGEWSSTALYQVGHEFTLKLQLSDAPPGSAEADAKKGYDSDDERNEKPKPKAKMGSGTERDKVVSTLVYVHESVQKAMIMLARNTNKRTYVTPRHYLDFINHYARMSDDKRRELEEQQMHLRSGLRKLVDTQKEVAVLKEALRKKEIELQVKEKQANEKLEQMMVDKREAESKRDASIQIAEEIKAQEGSINERKVKVEAELAQAKPALEEAAEAVRNIAKADLDQVSRFPNPPGPVKLALEPVILMIGEDISDWQNIRKILRRSDPSFIKSILEYDINLLKEPLRKKIESRYLTDPSFTFEIVYNASKACGPLVKWVSSTIEYARIKNSVQPLIDEMDGLEEKAKLLHNKQEELGKIREELSNRIEQYKLEYSKLVGEAQGIKNEMESVLKKVGRSETLLANLGTEQVRWNADCEGFQTQISTIVGDSLLAAAFLAYIGYFNQNYRAMLVEKWTDRLTELTIKTKSDLSLINYMSQPSERLEWISHELPDDELCIENAIMMKRFNRYPLIIDPSGQATVFLMKQYKDRKIIRTSFLDDAFLKNLESSLRFGNALLVEDVESLDPVLNSVLNKEIFRQGGRVMITLGDKEIDFSPTFVIFLSTRDPACHFTPDLCSRVTFVNFTVTHSSLTTQCLGKLLKAERPDIDKKRSDMLKLQGEFRVKLRELEDKLLAALSGVKGNILDDESVMSTLETLKNQSAEVTQKMNDSQSTAREIEEVSGKYRSFAVSCSSTYFTLENISNVHFLYQFSLPFFLGIVDKILVMKSAEVKAISEPMERLRQLTKEMFEITFQRVSRALLHEDQVGFGVRLAQIARDDGMGKAPQPLPFSDMEFLLKGRSKTSVTVPPALVSGLGLSNPQVILLGYLLSLPNFAGLKDHLGANTAAWRAWMVNPSEKSDEKAEYVVPGGWEKSKDKTEKLFHHLLVCKVLRADRLTEVAGLLVKEVFGDKFLASTNSFNLAKVVAEEGDARTPLLLVSKPGYDPSSKIDKLAEDLKKGDKYTSFAMGSPEGYAIADTAISTAAKVGHWILLKNVHLSPSWLTGVEKRLHRMAPHQDFRIFMTMEMNPNVPANLFRMSNIIIFEPPVGMKSSMTRMFNSFQPERFNKAPAERGRLYFMLAWIHSVILERLRYVPVGWTKGFEFSENDIKCAMDAVDEWVDRKAQGKANLPPAQIPWDALRALLNQVIYGGRIDNEFDQARLEAFVQSLFVDKAYEYNFPLASAWSTKDNTIKPLLTMPDVKDYAGFKDWVEKMSNTNSPELLGLPSNAENMLLSYAAEHMCYQLLQLQDHGGDAEGAEGEVETSPGDDHATVANKIKAKRLSFSLGGDVKADRPSWMISMEASVRTWMKELPEANALPALPTGSKQAELLLNPLYRCFQREYNLFRNTLATVLEDLKLVAMVLSGAEPANNKCRALFIKLKKDQLPTEWLTYGSSLKSVPTTVWITDFTKRVQQMAKLMKVPAEKYTGEQIWLGALQSPEAFVAASRQAVAQAHGWSLEDLSLKITVDDKSAANPDSFTFTGMELQGASWKNNGLTIDNTEMACKMPPVRFTWIKNMPAESTVIKVPCYLDYTRNQYLFSVNLARPKDVPEAVWSQRGICLVVWKV